MTAKIIPFPGCMETPPPTPEAPPPPSIWCRVENVVLTTLAIGATVAMWGASLYNLGLAVLAAF